MFRGSLRLSSGVQTAFSLPVVFCPVKRNPYEVLWRVELCCVIVVCVCVLGGVVLCNCCVCVCVCVGCVYCGEVNW